MNADVHELTTPCRGAPCQSYGPGHNVHHIHARRIGESPWGWRDAIVTAVDGLIISLTYLQDGAGAVLWHHHLTPDGPTVGDPVRVHEEYHALGSPAGWFNVAVLGGLGPIERPVNVDDWRKKMTIGVADSRTGRGLPLDHLDP